MAKNKKAQIEDPEEVLESALNKTENFLARNGKMLLTILSVIVLAVCGYFGYQHLYKAPRMDKAAAAMMEAQYKFEASEYEAALKGDTSFDGFEAIAEEYGSLPQGNLAKHYAGICNLYLGNYDAAIEFFNSFDTSSGLIGEVITANNIGMIGDAHMQLGNKEKGVEMYEKAASHCDNADTTPKYLKKAAMVNMALGNNQKALDQLNKIKFDYPQSHLRSDIDKYIAQVEQKL